MQQWLNEPKNQPIVYGIAGIIMIASIVFILFRLQVIGAPKPYVPPIATVNAPQNGVPSGMAPAPVPGASAPTASAPPIAPTVPTGPGRMPSSARHMPGMNKVAGAAGQRRQGRPHGKGNYIVGSPSAFNSLAQAINKHVATGAPVVIAAAPNFRSDPFAPYGGIRPEAAAPKPRVSSFVPVYNIYVQNGTQVASNTPGGYGNYPGAQGGGPQEPGGPNMNGAGPASDVTLSGVMLGNGAYALVNADNNSLVLSPGDQLPDNGGQLISIQTDSISVKTTDGQIVKIPITTGQPTGEEGYGGQGQGGYPGGGPPNGYQGTQGYQGGYPQQGPGRYRPQQNSPYPQQGYQGGGMH